jgi:hypothetical protein
MAVHEALLDRLLDQIQRPLALSELSYNPRP